MAKDDDPGNEDDAPDSGASTEKPSAKEAPASPPPAPPVTPPGPGEQHVVILTDENGDGALLVGLDLEDVHVISTSDGSTVNVAEAHTIGITRLSVTDAPTKDGKVTVTIAATD